MSTPLGNLVKTPLKNFKDLGGDKGDLATHALHKYHLRAAQAAKDFIQTYENPEKEIANQTSSQRLRQIQENRVRLQPIVKSIIFCGRNNISLRGHRDDGRVVDLGTEANDSTSTGTKKDQKAKDKASKSSKSPSQLQDGTFKQLLAFRVDSGDKILEEHLKKSSARATYISKTTQNELIQCCSLEISEEILKRVRAARFYSILFDETTDIAGLSQLSLTLRYIYEGSIREDFIEFLSSFDELGKFVAKKKKEALDAGSTLPGDGADSDTGSDDEEAEAEEGAQELSMTGEAVGQLVLDRIKNSYFLDVKMCVGVGTDSCSVMVSELCGAVAEIIKEAVNALRTPCYNHKLNNALSKSNRVPQAKKAMSTMSEISSFCVYPKRRHVVMKTLGCSLKALCETRLVERHDGVIQFQSDLPKVIDAFYEISNWKDANTASKAHSLMLAMCDTEFIIALCCLSSVLSYTKQLSLALQTEDLDLSRGSEMISSAISVLTRQREEAEKSFDSIWQTALDLVKRIDMDPRLELTIPRQCKRQTFRSNYPATSDPKDYYRRAIYIPILDNIIADHHERFPPESLAVFSLPLLLPAKMVTATGTEDIGKLAETLWENFHRVLPIEPSIGQRSLASEITVWKETCVSRLKSVNPMDRRTGVMAALDACSSEIFPLVSTLFKLLATLPVSNATPERSFSTLRRIKTWLRSTKGESRLVGLALLNIHKDIEVSVEKIIDRFAKMKKRRVDFAI